MSEAVDVALSLTTTVVCPVLSPTTAVCQISGYLFPVRRSPLKSLSFRQEIGEKNGIDSCFMSRIITFPSYLCRCLHPIPPVICQWYHVVLKWYLSVLSFCQLTITFCIFDFCSYCWRRTRSSWWAALSGSRSVSWCHFPYYCSDCISSTLVHCSTTQPRSF